MIPKMPGGLVIIAIFFILPANGSSETIPDTVYADAGDSGTISIPIAAGELSQTIQGLRLEAESPSDLFVLPISVLGPVDIPAASTKTFVVTYQVSLRATPGPKRLRMRYASFDDSELLDDVGIQKIDPIDVLIFVSTAVIQGADQLRGAPSEQPESKRFIDQSGREMVRSGPSPAAWVRFESEQTMAEVRSGVVRVGELLGRVAGFDSGTRGVIDAYTSLLSLEDTYTAILSSVSVPNPRNRFPEQTFAVVIASIAATADSAWVTGPELRRRHAGAARRAAAFRQEYPGLQQEIASIIFPSSRRFERWGYWSPRPVGFKDSTGYSPSNIPTLFKHERAHDPKGPSHALLMRLADVAVPAIRNEALWRLGETNDGKEEVAEFLYAAGFPATRKDNVFLGVDAVIAIDALGKLGAPGAVATKALSTMLSTEHFLIGQVELPYRALKGIGTPGARKILEEFDRRSFETSGKSTSVPHGVTGWKGFYSGIMKVDIRLARDQASWSELWESHAPGTIAPVIDFSTEMVLGLFFGEQHLEFPRIADLESNRDGVQLTYSVLHPDFVADANYEFILARVPFSRKTVVVLERADWAMTSPPAHRERIQKTFPGI